MHMIPRAILRCNTKATAIDVSDLAIMVRAYAWLPKGMYKLLNGQNIQSAKRSACMPRLKGAALNRTTFVPKLVTRFDSYFGKRSNGA